MELEPNSLDWNGNELEHKLEDMKRTYIFKPDLNSSGFKPEKPEPDKS